ncbi:hypothetical protein ACHAXR_003270 [Thalassiosira sp. AJA248-18]
MRGSRRLGSEHFLDANHWEASSCLQLSLRLAVVHFMIASI